MTTDLAAEAFIYGFPLVFDLEEVDRFVHRGLGSVPPAPFNTFAHATKLAGPKDKFVSINNDTIYSIANVDTSGGPVRLEVPDTNGRYYVLQFVDAWTNNFAYVGHRATGTTPARSCWWRRVGTATAPADATVIRFPTAVATIVGRWAVDGEADLPAVRALQARTHAHAERRRRRAARARPARTRGPRFFEQLRVWMRAFPPAERDRAYQERFAPLGLFAADSPYADADPALADALRGGLAAGKERMEPALKHGSSPRRTAGS